MQIFTLDNGEFIGEYHRVDSNSYEVFAEENVSRVKKAPSFISDHLSGKYLSVTDDAVYHFTQQELVVAQRAGIYKGAYSLFERHGSVYLEVDLKGATSAKRRSETFRVELSKTQQELAEAQRATDIILLYPVRLLGSEELRRSGAVLRLEKVAQVHREELEDLLPGS